MVKYIYILLVLTLPQISLANENDCNLKLSPNDLRIKQETLIQLVSLEKPNYEKYGRLDGLENNCLILRFDLNDLGNAENVRVEYAYPDNRFNQVSIKALQQSKFIKSNAADRTSRLMVFSFGVLEQVRELNK